MEIEGLLRGRLLPEIRRRLGYEGDVRRATGPDAESAMVKTVEVAAYQTGAPGSRIEVPIDIRSVPCLDRPVMKTVDGVGYLTVSDADMVESKVLALFLRHRVEARDLVDLYFFSSAFLPDSTERLREKVRQCPLRKDAVREGLRAMIEGRDRHVKAIRGVLDEQVERPVVDQIETAGGAGMIFDAVMDRVRSLVGPWVEGAPS